MGIASAGPNFATTLVIPTGRSTALKRNAWRSLWTTNVTESA